MTYIDPTQDLRRILARVENPGRYVGGEFGAVQRAHSDDYIVALSFPDLYEIGMSNTAVKLLYTVLNSIPGVRCERVFAPAPDFEAALGESQLPLYTLESGIPLRETDMVAFSVGYELTATNILTILDRGGVSLRASDRDRQEPLVIAGGMISMNPVPFGEFFDGVFVGEAEAELQRIVSELAGLKKRGAGRADQRAVLQNASHVWWRGSTHRVRRAIWTDFGNDATFLKAPVPNIKVVQDHGVVEIMRGCPQGCRFCNAGMFYRPVRMKDYDAIEREVENLVRGHGYRHITLSSLSSGDYADAYALFRYLNARFADDGVSFALPSLRVNSFTLPLLAEISRVRKSGLTFAVETPGEAGQLAVNKRVPLERTRAILESAKAQGWRLAKFYFMLGLPVPEEDEARAIADYMAELRSSVKMNFNVAVATFVPKPHTPLQWAPQLGEYEALDRIMELKRELKRIGIKLSYQSPFQSFLEGMLSRGDKRVGRLIENAYHEGCRLDAWEEYLDVEAWRRVTAAADWSVEEELFRERDLREPLPWQVVSTGVSTPALKREYERSRRGELTEQCAPGCDHPCGVCNKVVTIREAADIPETTAPAPPRRQPARETQPEPDSESDRGPGCRPPVTAGDAVRRRRVLFRFSKQGRAVYTPHLGLMGVFERAYRRARLPVEYTEGFNPKPRQEFAQPLSLGIASHDEIAAVAVTENIQAEKFSEAMNLALPPGVRIHHAILLEEGGENLPSLMSRYWGSVFDVDTAEADMEPDALSELLSAAPGVRSIDADGSKLLVRIAHEGGRARGLGKLLKTELGCDAAAVGLSLVRLETLAVPPGGDYLSDEPVSYFDAYDGHRAGSLVTG